MIKKALSILAVMVIVFGVFTSLNEDQSAQAAQSLDEIEQELKEIEQEKQQINGELSNLKEQMAQVQSEKNTVENKLANLNYQIRTKEAEIDLKENEIAQTETEIRGLEKEIASLKEEIAKLEANIVKLKKEIKETEQRIAKREEILIERLRTLQRNGGSIKYLEVIMGAKDFGEFISRTSAVNKIMDQDQNILENHFADKEKLEKDKKAVEESKQVVVKKKEKVQANKAQAEQKRNKLVAKRNELNQLVASLGDKKKEQQIVLASLEKKENEIHQIQLSAKEEMKLIKQRERYLEQAKKVASGNGFITPSTGYISSHFNPNRVHPIYKYPRPHNGLDIANSRGTAIKAAASGVVYKTYTWCQRGNMSCGGGFGNAVFITHNINGKQYDTVYAHLSGVNVSEGQTVTAGQLIGRMGSTGASTGDHLHFEIHPGGYKNPTNPLNYVSAP
ncbi:hypothetical protein E3U55_02345 [Filobacillus milosensis]|uniref:BZIP domain-containing protein n=1 Tax=Filobacillus milosensis TaxID=94137 RepID=A0A4Y8IRD1_9BACI|nr:peptidoglycan DD-metalloendopeptidase family protein [Filobacillus milosensis]TFB24361.1 hypothetical protein E3U55_02345 [Filobacillus milosensis]